MLTKLSLENFKCFQKLELPLRPLTLLSGVNGGGKSTIIQALVLLSQTLSNREWANTLLLDGSELALGSVADVLNQQSSRHFSIGANTDIQKILWTFAANDRSALSVKMNKIIVNGELFEPKEGEPLRWLLPSNLGETSSVVTLLRQISWITAERMGPRELLPLKELSVQTQVGTRGEYAASLLHWCEYQLVDSKICLKNFPPTLLHQVRARMQEFFPDCDLRVSPINGASSISLRLRSNSRSEFQRPQNVGFGLTQLFPIIVALLTAKKGDCLLIENPEVHLHPKAQQHIGWLLALIAASGVQVIVETHSDHVLNGVRLAVKQKTISALDTAMHFFALDSNNLTKLHSPSIDEDGRLNEWPDGFFDQFDIALSELL